ncbi:transcriptional regulator [Colletotrichum lupini]|uniref:Transcriptional regulator n=1 Tax=Colletotrichum lupini TaxID=145971 RepID=A0A9Q8SDY8_9PEZI|nr:transcriptional regulator [Colletotrichum lupini]UQC75450.1 transcriptional regulator [Colletotrichum lupini]
MSQEMRKGDREGVIRGFQSLGSDGGQAIAALVQERSDMKELAKTTLAVRVRMCQILGDRS